jgi:hypothetical protein
MSRKMRKVAEADAVVEEEGEHTDDASRAPVAHGPATPGTAETAATTLARRSRSRWRANEHAPPNAIPATRLRLARRPPRRRGRRRTGVELAAQVLEHGLELRDDEDEEEQEDDDRRGDQEER